jgi:hypothetical protein
MKYICEKASTCKFTFTCLEANVHDEKDWCKSKSMCPSAKIRVRCVEVKE